MAVDLLLKNGKTVIGDKTATQSVAINAGKIEGIYKIGSEPASREVIECENLYILPGAIDTHVHLRDLKLSEKEDFATGTMAAAAGGVTTVVDMPNSDPPTLSRADLDEKIAEAQAKRFVNIGFYAGVPKKPSDFDHEMVPDILGAKVYPHSPLVKRVSYTKPRMEACLKISAEYGFPLLIHPDASSPSAMPESLDEYFHLHSCENEVESLRRFLDAQNKVGGRIHVCHVSCASTVRLVEEHRAEESLTAEACPHHLFLSGDGFENIDGTAKILPPLRSPYDASSLWDAIRRCTIDIVVSDHAPHTEQEKHLPFLEAASGIPGLETTVPLLLTEVLQGRLSWVEYLRCCCSAPARIFGLNDKGVLARGYDADIMIVSVEESGISGESFVSKAKITPLEGRRIVARPVKTIVGGVLVYDEGKFVVGRGVAGRVPVRKT